MRVYSDLATTVMAANGSFAGTMRLVMLTRCPSDPPSNAPPAIANLLADLGYQEITDSHYVSPTNRPSLTTTQTVTTPGTPPVSTRNVLMGGAIALPANVVPTYIAAVAFYIEGTVSGVVNPWVLITDESFRQIVYPGASLDTVLASPPPPRIMWSWSLRGTNVDTSTGGFQRSPGNIPWEPPRTQHVYLFPQRVNYVPNPSFEDVSNFGWRAKGVLTSVVGGVDNPLNHYGHVTGNRLESIPVGLSSNYACITAYVRGTTATRVQFGLCNWGEDWQQTSDVLSPFMPVSSDWTLLSFVARVPDNRAGSGVLIVSNGAFDVDLVMLEHSADTNAYFSGDSATGITGDFSWQGVTNQSLSFWYNNKYLVGARLFGTYTTGLVQKNGLVYDWVPAGTSIYTHWDVLSALDTKQPLVDFASRVIP